MKGAEGCRIESERTKGLGKWKAWLVNFSSWTLSVKKSYPAKQGVSQFGDPQMAVGQNQWYHFGVAAPPILVYSIGDWDDWGYGILTHGQMGTAGLSLNQKLQGSNLREAARTCPAPSCGLSWPTWRAWRATGQNDPRRAF